MATDVAAQSRNFKHQAVAAVFMECFLADKSSGSTRRWREGACTHSNKVLVISAQILAYLEFGVSAESQRSGEAGPEAKWKKLVIHAADITSVGMRGLACPHLPRLTAFSCTTCKSMIFHHLAYISFQSRKSLWSWPSTNMVTAI